MVKELLKQKELIAKKAYAERVIKNPDDIERYIPEDLREFSIDLVPGAEPVRQGMRRFAAEETQAIRKQVENMLQAGVIEACHSPFATGVVLARKKDGTFRFSVDLRKLNAITAENGDVVCCCRISTTAYASARTCTGLRSLTRVRPSGRFPSGERRGRAQHS